MLVRPRSLSTKLILLGAAVTSALVLYTYYNSSFSFDPRFPSFPLFSQRYRSTCPASEWKNGHWAYRPRSNLTTMSQSLDALTFAGFEGCASSREYFWHLASDTPEQYNRFPDASSWDWVPGEGCHIRQFNRESMVRDLVEDGGWFLLGDSITEGHFFSLSCMLYPHVRATPNYTENPYFDRAWAQNLYLDPASPLIPFLSLPPGFDITTTPLVTFRRVDLLLDKPELVSFYSMMHSHPTNFSLFSEETFWSLSPSYYMSLFTAPLPEANYATLIVSTGGHWTTTVFSGLRNESNEDSGYGIENVISFFGETMQKWAGDLQHALDEDHRKSNTGTPSTQKHRRVVVRAYLPGHEDCHNHLAPWTEIQPFQWKWYNWPWIEDLNHVFEKTLSSPLYPDIHYLPIDRPARLRPDAHATGDCLHIMAGAGVMEGWSHYIWHFVTRELGSNVR